eukprot:CFRG0932T1
MGIKMHNNGAFYAWTIKYRWVVPIVATLEVSLVMNCLSSMCLAIAAMHNMDPPYIHRDLKVENILIDGQHNFRLCDFGSATPVVAWAGSKRPHVDGSQHYITTRVDIEMDIEKHTTPQYRSPEMVDLYQDQPITEKCDIWALGCVLYKLLYGDTPFGDSMLSISSGHVTFPTKTTTTVTSATQQKLNTLITLMLDPDPNTRPDIFAVSHHIHALLGQPNPVKDKRLCVLMEMFPTIAPDKLKAGLERSRVLEDTINSFLESTHVLPQVQLQTGNFTQNSSTPTKVSPTTNVQVKTANLYFTHNICPSPILSAEENNYVQHREQQQRHTQMAEFDRSITNSVHCSRLSPASVHASSGSAMNVNIDKRGMTHQRAKSTPLASVTSHLDNPFIQQPISRQYSNQSQEEAQVMQASLFSTHGQQCIQTESQHIQQLSLSPSHAYQEQHQYSHGCEQTGDVMYGRESQSASSGPMPVSINVTVPTDQQRRERPKPRKRVSNTVNFTFSMDQTNTAQYTTTANPFDPFEPSTSGLTGAVVESHQDGCNSVHDPFTVS